MSSIFIFKQNLISHSSRPRVHLSKGSGCFSSIFFFVLLSFFCFVFVSAKVRHLFHVLVFSPSYLAALTVLVH